MLTCIDSEPHAEPEILCVAETALDLPTLGIEVDQGPRGFVGGAGREAPRLFHALRPHADHGGDRIRLGGNRRAAQCSRATTGANPIGRRARLATGGGDRDVAAKADDEVELQFLGQHPVELVVAETAIGHDAHPDIGGQDFGQARQDLILVAVATVFQRRLVHGQPNQRRGPSRGGTTETA